ncbi:MAG: RluA family pseudouridine synthase [Cellulosilyticum sp.]|nr:RluA family pseudouridine synthase [Cellulosilyticum sp.]
MERRLTYHIDEEHHGKTIGMFLKEKEYSRGVLIELKKTTTGIRRNGVWAGVNQILQTGDTLEICLVEEVPSENVVPVEGELQILYEDEDILVINKPDDTPIHPSVNNYDNTLANKVAYYYERQGRPYVFRCINRLDRDTTGVTIIAKNLLSASILSNRVKERQLSRVYIAFVEGITEEKGIIDLPIGRAEGSIIKRQIDKKEGKHAVTHYQRLHTFDIEGKPISVVALKLETGRTHQIRVHMSAIGHPLLGDFLYNENNHMLGRQGLHGVLCSFTHPITGEYMDMMAPLPRDMERLLHKAKEVDGACTSLKEKLKKIKWDLI